MPGPPCEVVEPAGDPADEPMNDAGVLQPDGGRELPAAMELWLITGAGELAADGGVEPVGWPRAIIGTDVWPGGGPLLCCPVSIPGNKTSFRISEQ